MKSSRFATSDRVTVGRWAGWLAGVWTGVLASIGAMAAPVAFATLAAPDAGRFVARLFAQEAYLALAMALALLLALRLRARVAAESGFGSRMSVDMMLVFATLFCTVGGYFAVQPMMEAAKLGQGRWSFGTLHAVSGSLFIVKGVLVAVLAWRLAAVRVKPFSRVGTS